MTTKNTKYNPNQPSPLPAQAFTAKERDTETGLDYFGARYYSSGLSVWLSVDALTDKYPGTSAFMYVHGNPVMLVDPDGREINPAGDSEEKAYNDFKTYVNRRITNYDNKTMKLRAKNTKFSNWRANRRDKRRCRNEYVKIRLELEQLEGAKEVYKIRMGENITSESSGADTYYNGDTKEIDVNIKEGGDFTVMQKMAHELKHVYQYHVGEIDFELFGNKSGSGILYDQSDERAAYERQNYFPGRKIYNVAEFVRKVYRNLNYSSISVEKISNPSTLRKLVELKMEVLSPNALKILNAR